jgi:hypothetical protein
MSTLQQGHTFSRKRSIESDDDRRPDWTFPLLYTAPSVSCLTKHGQATGNGREIDPEAQEPEQPPPPPSRPDPDKLLQDQNIDSRYTNRRKRHKRTRQNPDFPVTLVHDDSATVSHDLEIGIRLTESLMDAAFVDECDTYTETEVKVDIHKHGLVQLSCLPVSACDIRLLQTLKHHISTYHLTATMYWCQSTTDETPDVCPSIVAFLRHQGCTPAPTPVQNQDQHPEQEQRNGSGMSVDELFVARHATLLGFTPRNEETFKPEQLEPNSLYVFQRLPLPWKRFIRTFLQIDVVGGTSTAHLHRGTRRRAGYNGKPTDTPVNLVWALSSNTQSLPLTTTVQSPPGVAQSWILPLVDLQQIANQVPPPGGVTACWSVHHTAEGLDLVCQVATVVDVPLPPHSD